jgi:hypothetical protein
MFDLQLLPRTKLKSVTNEDGTRVYQTPAGKFPSVTTVLSNAEDKTWLHQWRARVGTDAAKAITAKASKVGSKLHKLAETFLLNGKPTEAVDPFVLERFDPIREELETSVSIVYGVEFSLWSPVLKAAGTTDLICQYNRIPSIVDFKTSRRMKSEKDILSYFLQATAYAKMVNERFPIDIKQIVIIMSVEHENRPRIFIKNPTDYWPIVKKVFIDGEKLS